MSKSEPLFTVLTATRNCLPFVGHCMRSVLSQKYRNWEMIVVDDCSKDRTYKRACEIAARHPRIKVIKNNHRMYCGATYAKLLSMAKGDICGVLDGDDTLPKDAIETIVHYYKKYKLDFIWTNHTWYNKDMSRSRRGISHKPKKGTIYDSENGLKHVYSHWRTFKTEMRDRGELFDVSLKCTVDKDLGYTLEELGHGGFLDKKLYNYRYYQENMSHNSSQKATWAKVREKHRDRNRNKVIVI